MEKDEKIVLVEDENTILSKSRRKVLSTILRKHVLSWSDWVGSCPSLLESRNKSFKTSFWVLKNSEKFPLIYKWKIKDPKKEYLHVCFPMKSTDGWSWFLQRFFPESDVQVVNSGRGLPLSIAENSMVLSFSSNWLAGFFHDAKKVFANEKESQLFSEEAIAILHALNEPFLEVFGALAKIPTTDLWSETGPIDTLIPVEKVAIKVLGGSILSDVGSISQGEPPVESLEDYMGSKYVQRVFKHYHNECC